MPFEPVVLFFVLGAAAGLLGSDLKIPGSIYEFLSIYLLLAFYDFPAEHWVHLRTTNPIESTFATVRHRTTRTKNCASRNTFLGLAFKLAEEAAKTWRRIRAPEKVAELLGGARYEDGIPVPNDSPEEQRVAA